MPPKNKGASGKGGGKGGKGGGKDKGGAADAGQQKEKKGGTSVKVFIRIIAPPRGLRV